MHTFVLKDADGVEHQYQVLPHDADKGERIMWQLDAMLVGPLGALLQSQLGRVIAAEASVNELLGAKVEDVFQGIDLLAVGRDLATHLRGPEILALSAELMQHTTRDGLPMSVRENRSVAYQRNYWELRRALFEIIRYNRFFPLPGA